MQNINLKIIGVLISLIVIVGGIYLYQKSKHSSLTETPNPLAVSLSNPYANSTIETKTFQNDDKSFGYDILVDDHIYVHQPSVPAVGGNAGFKSEVDAEKTGEFVAEKIKNNILPPTVSPEELKTLGVL